MSTGWLPDVQRGRGSFLSREESPEIIEVNMSFAALKEFRLQRAPRNGTPNKVSRYDADG